MDDEVYERLQALYDSLPTVECQGLCYRTCGPIQMSVAEHTRIRTKHGVEIQPFTDSRSKAWADGARLDCAALDRMGRCTVYEDRPMICRIWGVGRGEMACPWGCTVTGERLRNRDVMRLVGESYRIGEHPDGLTEENYALSEAMLADPEIAAAMDRFVQCGDTAPLRALQGKVDVLRARLGVDPGRIDPGAIFR